MSTFISVGGYEASAMLNEPAFWLAPRSLPCLSHSPSVPVSSIAFTLSLCRAPSSLFVRPRPIRPVLGRPRRTGALLLSVRFTETPSSLFAPRPPVCRQHTLSRARSSLSVGHEGASIPRPSVLCTPRSLMGRVRSGQPEGKLIPRRSDGNAFLARPPPALSPAFPRSPLPPSRGKSRGKRRRGARDLLGYPQRTDAREEVRAVHWATGVDADRIFPERRESRLRRVLSSPFPSPLLGGELRRISLVERETAARHSYSSIINRDPPFLFVPRIRRRREDVTFTRFVHADEIGSTPSKYRALISILHLLAKSIARVRRSKRRKL